MERAGYVESNNRIGRVSETGRLSAPKWAVLDRGYIHWKGRFSSMVKPSPELLDRFSELWRGDHVTILEFAKQERVGLLVLGQPRRRGIFGQDQTRMKSLLNYFRARKQTSKD